MNWSAFEAAAPALAGAAKARFDATHIALLGTLRRDGSPRISPIEPYFTADELLLGAMARSAKARDLMLDPRCVLHNAISDPNAGEPEFKLYGTVEQVAADAPTGAWWQSRPQGRAGRVCCVAARARGDGGHTLDGAARPRGDRTQLSLEPALEEHVVVHAPEAPAHLVPRVARLVRECEHRPQSFRAQRDLRPHLVGLHVHVQVRVARSKAARLVPPVHPFVVTRPRLDDLQAAFTCKLERALDGAATSCRINNFRA
jgi:Pyridoxamine 5'-phosphate oxidase